VQVIFHHRPLYGIAGHETSETAAILSEIAAEQGKFWRFVDRLYREPHQVGQNGYLGLMRELGLATPQLQSLLADPHSAPALRVQRDRALADRLGVHLTPTFVVVIDHKAPVCANRCSLATMLNSAEVQAIFGVGDPTTGWPKIACNWWTNKSGRSVERPLQFVFLLRLSPQVTSQQAQTRQGPAKQHYGRATVWNSSASEQIHTGNAAETIRSGAGLWESI